MTTIKRFNGSSFPQSWDRSSNICSDEQVWIDGVVTENPFYFTIDMLLSIDGVTSKEVTKSQKWGESYSLEIYFNGAKIHFIDTGIQTSQYAARCTNSKVVTRHFDVSDGILSDVDSTWVTDFRQAAQIKPYDYNKVQPFLNIPSMGDYTDGSVKYGTDILRPLSSNWE